MSEKVPTEDYDLRIITALESIAESLKILAEKPVPGITLEVSPDLISSPEALK